jgi:GH43 family beta-xylosidase
MVRWDTIPDYVWTLETLAQLKKYGDNIWAPQVVKIKDQWLMYVSCYTSESKSAIAVLTLDSETFPTGDGAHGPWSFHSVLTQSSVSKIHDTIDPFVVEDPETGKVWMFFGGVDKVYRVELASDGLSLAEENPTYTHVAGLKYSEDHSREKVFEASSLYYHDGYWYLFVSAGLYSDYSYSLKVGRSETLTGDFVDKNGNSLKDGIATKILSTTKSSTDFWGPGHNGGIFKDIEGRTYMYYHCHAKDVPVTVAGYTPRALMLQQMFWGENGWPYFKGGKPVGTEECPAYTNSYYELSVPASQWTTVYLPFAFEIPEGMEVYTPDFFQSPLLHITKMEKTEANMPYLVKASEGYYDLSGYARDTIDGQINGLLVGTHSQIAAPANTYVLEDGSQGVGFYRAGSYVVPAHNAYMQVETTDEYILTGNFDGLDAIKMNESNSIEAVYNLGGQKINGSQKGISIVRMSDGTIKKVVIVK